MSEKVLIVDFGSQLTQLIARRVRESGVYCEIVPYHKAEEGLAQLATLSLDNVHFMSPVRPGDHLRLEAQLTTARRSLRKPDRGIMTFEHHLYNQDDAVVIEVNACLLVARRPLD